MRKCRPPARPKSRLQSLENKDYQLPSIQLLDDPKHTGQQADKKNIYDNARKLERTFQSFGVKAKVTQVHLGPAVTKYEVYPDVGVKVSKIVNLSDDLALALAAKDIRIEAPIPGKSAIGIEVPNAEVAMVSLKEVLESKLNDRPDAKLMIGLGRNISGEAVLAEPEQNAPPSCCRSDRKREKRLCQRDHYKHFDEGKAPRSEDDDD